MLGKAAAGFCGESLRNSCEMSSYQETTYGDVGSRSRVLLVEQVDAMLQLEDTHSSDFSCYKDDDEDLISVRFLQTKEWVDDPPYARPNRAWVGDWRFRRVASGSSLRYQ